MASLPTPPPESSEQPPAATVGGAGAGNLVDSILQSIQSGSGADGGVDVPMDPTGVAGGFDLLPPLSEFARARQAVLEVHIPRVERLARNVIAGITRAYEPGIHPSRTADDVQALEEALAALRAILHESGLGALPVDPSQLTSITSPLKDAQSPQKEKDASGGIQQPNLLTDEKLSSKRVEEVFARVQRRREAAGVALDVLAQQQHQ